MSRPGAIHLIFAIVFVKDVVHRIDRLTQVFARLQSCQASLLHLTNNVVDLAMLVSGLAHATSTDGVPPMAVIRQIDSGKELVAFLRNPDTFFLEKTRIISFERNR